MELERTVEPSWPKLVEPLEKIVDRLSVVWGIVNHLKSVKDSFELRSAIEEVQVCVCFVCMSMALLFCYCFNDTVWLFTCRSFYSTLSLLC